MNEMYKKSEPSVTWKYIMKTYNGDTDEKEWFRKYTISEEDYFKIKEKYRKKLHKMYHNDLDMILLNYSPTFKEIKLLSVNNEKGINKMKGKNKPKPGKKPQK